MNKVDKAMEQKNADRPVALKVEHVSKNFKLPVERAGSLKNMLFNWLRGIRGYRTQEVLKDITFDIKQGEFFGIVGKNGSGKSTLLKLISQIYTPNTGTIEVDGKLVPFIELGVGFNPELTGRENVYLNGAMLGFSNDEIDAMYDDIVEFAELEDFMDQKLKNYSSGMQVRLAFSVAIKAQGDILVLDEVLAVGDEAFQRKCDNFFAEIKKDPTKTVILVTHSMDAVKKYCNKAILIKDGEIIASGDKNDVADRYTLENLKQTDSQDTKEVVEESNKPWLKVLTASKPVCGKDDVFEFDIEYFFDQDVDFYFTMTLIDMKRGGLTFDPGPSSYKFHRPGHHKIRFALPVSIFNNGDFQIVASLRVDDPDNPKKPKAIAFANGEDACVFAIRDSRNGDYALLNNDILSIKCKGLVD